MDNKRRQYDLMVEHLEHERRARENAIRESQLIIRHYQTSQVGVAIPFLQSAITAVLAAILVTAGAVHWWAWSWYKTFGIAFVVILLSDWLRRCGAWSNSVHALERALQVDINLDGWIGPEPEPQPEPEDPFRVEVWEPESGRFTWATFPVSKTKMCDFADSLMRGQPFSVSGFSGPGALFSRGEYDKTIAELIKRDLAEKVNPDMQNSTVQLTNRGWHVMRALAAEHRGVHPDTIPLPHQVDK